MVNRININFTQCVRAHVRLWVAVCCSCCDKSINLSIQSFRPRALRSPVAYVSSDRAHCISIHCVSRVQRSISVSMSNFVTVGQTVAELWRLIDFFKCQMSTIVTVLTRFEPSSKCIWWSLSLCKILLTSMQ